MTRLQGEVMLGPDGRYTRCRHCGADMKFSPCCGRVEGLEAKLAQVVEVLRTTQLHLIALAERYPQESLLSNLRDSLATYLAAAKEEP